MFRLRAYTVTNFWLWKRLLKPIFGRLHILSLCETCHLPTVICQFCCRIHSTALLKHAGKTSFGVLTDTLLLDCCLRRSKWLRDRGRGQEDLVVYTLSTALQGGFSSPGAVRSSTTPKVPASNPGELTPLCCQCIVLPDSSPSITAAPTPTTPLPCFLDTKQCQELIKLPALPQTPHLTLDTVKSSPLAPVHHLQRSKSLTWFPFLLQPTEADLRNQHMKQLQLCVQTRDSSTWRTINSCPLFLPHVPEPKCIYCLRER